MHNKTYRGEFLEIVRLLGRMSAPVNLQPLLSTAIQNARNGYHNLTVPEMGPDWASLVLGDLELIIAACEPRDGERQHFQGLSDLKKAHQLLTSNQPVPLEELIRTFSGDPLTDHERGFLDGAQSVLETASGNPAKFFGFLAALDTRLPRNEKREQLRALFKPDQGTDESSDRPPAESIHAGAAAPAPDGTTSHPTQWTEYPAGYAESLVAASESPTLESK